MQRTVELFSEKLEPRDIPKWLRTQGFLTALLILSNISYAAPILIKRRSEAFYWCCLSDIRAWMSNGIFNVICGTYAKCPMVYVI